MGSLKTFARGQTIIHQDEMSREMYILLNGTAEARVNTAGHSRLVARLQHGEVFGDMGLIRGQKQPAEVVAIEDVEVLAINEHFLRRVKQRYPRIAAQIFFNLTHIMGDRLDWLLEIAKESRPERVTYHRA